MRRASISSLNSLSGPANWTLQEMKSELPGFGRKLAV
jgi:hypothetical protein